MLRVAPTKMFVTVQDITDRKRAEEALQLSQFYLSEGERLAHMGSWAFNPVGFDYWSAELFEVHGLDPSGRPPIVERYSPHDCVQNVCQVSRNRNGCGGVPKFVFPMPVTNIEKTSFTESQRTLPKLQLLCVSTLVSSGARSRSFVVWQSTHK